MKNHELRSFDTFVDLSRHRAKSSPDALAYRFLLDGEVDGPAERVLVEV